MTTYNLVVNKSVEYGHTATNKMFVQWWGSVSSSLYVSLFKLCRGTGRNWSALAFRFAPLLSPPMPATAQTQTLVAMAAGQFFLSFIGLKIRGYTRRQNEQRKRQK